MNTCMNLRFNSIVLAVILIILIGPLVEAKVVISEIMYNPAGNEQDFEYVELFGNESVSGWSFEGIDFVFGNVTIEGYTIIASDVPKFKERYGHGNGTHASFGLFDSKGSLKNTGETIILRDATGEIVDVVTYDDWAEENYSLERVDLKGYSSDPRNWVGTMGGTPGWEHQALPIVPNETCTWGLSIQLNQSISVEPAWKVKVVHMGPKANVTIVQQVKNAFGETVEDYTIDFEDVVSQRTSRTYSPSLKSGGYIISVEMANSTCGELVKTDELVYVPVSTEKRNASEINISVDEKEYAFGDTIGAEIHIYRGDTKSYALHAVVRNEKQIVSDKITIHAKTAYVEQTVVVPIVLRCGRYEPGTYRLVVEGLGVSQMKDIVVKEGCDSAIQTGLPPITERKKLNYSVDYPEIIESHKKFDVNVDIEGDNEPHEFQIAAWIYRGSTRIAESTMRKVTLKPLEKERVVFPLIVNQTIEGAYKLKVSIIKDGQKTPKELIEEVVAQTENKEVINSTNSEVKSDDGDKQSGAYQRFDMNELQQKRGIVIYESTSVRMRELAPWIASAAMGLLAVSLVLRKS